MSTTGESAQPRATMTPSRAHAPEGKPAERLEWQSELDSAMADLDSRLSHPRRRASDTGPQPTLPQLGHVEITNELLDEIAWRVAEQVRRPQPAAEPGELRHGVAISIRLRKPLFRWRFWRRTGRRRSMISLSDHRI
jgi:hypothetical protein